MNKNNQSIKFENKKLWCRCSTGRCPNYNVRLCGKGGKVIKKSWSYENVLLSIKEALHKDEYVGMNGYYQRCYKARLQEKKNGKQISVGAT